MSNLFGKGSKIISSIGRRARFPSATTAKVMPVISAGKEINEIDFRKPLASQLGAVVAKNHVAKPVATANSNTRVSKGISPIKELSEAVLEYFNVESTLCDQLPITGYVQVNYGGELMRRELNETMEIFKENIDNDKKYKRNHKQSLLDVYARFSNIRNDKDYNLAIQYKAGILRYTQSASLENFNNTLANRESIWLRVNAAVDVVKALHKRKV